MDIVLVPGLWLDGSAWDSVVPDLVAAGHRPVAVTLPGQGDGNVSATLADQVAAVVAAIDAASGKVLLVGHSAACALVWPAADRRRDKVARVAMVGGVPQPEGQAYAPFFEARDGLVQFPGWEPFAGPDSDDLDDATKSAVAAGAHAVPEAVTAGKVTYTDPERYSLPVVLVCPEYSPEDARAWVEGGDVPELTPATDVTYVDIDSGHWPMFSKPAELARVIAGLAT